MDASFQFPRHTAPIPRPAPSVTTPMSPNNRESNALRASVLDVALELGIGHNSTVLNWMFNNSLTEEDEEELRSPSPIHESPVTSEESSSGRSPLAPPSTHAQPSFQPIPAKLFPVENRIPFDKYVDKNPDRPVTGGGITFSDPPVLSRPTTPSRGKLRKKRADGYESDGGYMSDGGKKKKEREKEAKERAKEEKQQEKREKEEERKRKKSMKIKKGEDKDGYATGYDTDGTSKKSKGKTGDGGYETDSGYLSSTSTKGKSKGRFFGLKSKQPKGELHQEEVPPMPAVEKELVVLPIASKFATTIDTGPLITGESLDSMISKAMDGSMASALAAPSVAISVSSISMSSSHPTSPTSFSPASRESLGSTESSGSMSATASSLSHSHSKRRGFQFFGQDLVSSSGSGNQFNTPPSSQISLPPSTVSTPSSATQSFPPISLHNIHSSKRSPTSIDTSVEPSSTRHSPSRNSNSPPSAFSPVQHSSSNDLSNPSSAFSPVQHSSSNSLNNSPSAFSPVQHSSSNSLNSPPSAFTPQVFPTTRNPSLSRGLSFTRTQAPQGSVSTPEPSIPISPVSALPTQPVHSLPAATTQPTHLSTHTAVQPPRLSPITITESSPRLPLTTSTSAFRPSPTATTQALRLRPRNPPIDGFGARPTLTTSTIPSSPSVSSSPNSSSPSAVDSPQSLTIIPSTDYIVPSPNASPLPLSSPSVLAYYDIPPPSPPPSGPLPKIPPPGNLSSRSRTLERPANGTVGRSRTPEPRLFNQPIPSIQRGRESPFPPRPILPQVTVPSVSPGQEVNVPRYRELYGLSLPKDKNDQAVEQREVDKVRDWVKERDSMAKRSSDGSWDAIAAYGGSEDDDEDEDMRDVLERFEDARIDMEIDAIQNELNGGKTLGRSQSFEAIKKRIRGRYEDYHGEDDEDEAPRKSMEDDGDTNSRWSGTMSIYSRASVLDPEKSEEARQRFIKRVEDLYGDGGREKIPPVPKIPDAFIDGSGRSWTRF